MLTSRTLSLHSDGPLTYISFPLLDACGAVRHVFSTRLGGVSQGIYASMNLSNNIGDDPNAVRNNYDRICRAVGIDPAHLVLTHQTHTDHLMIVGQQDRGKGLFCPQDFHDIDGLITNQPGVALVTQFADCTPLLFCDPVKRVIATSHAGWRGTAAQIGPKTVAAMREHFGCDPADILCAIGPSIGPCCYEVDAPVYDPICAIHELDPSRLFTPTTPGHYRFNLWETNRQMLLNSGILPEHIDVTDLCTCCHSDVFHSHRATGGKRGTLAAIIELKEERKPCDNA